MTLSTSIVAFVSRHGDGVETRALLPLASGDAHRLGLVLWELAVRGVLNVRYGSGDEAERVHPGPCHAVAQRYATTCAWCADRLAAAERADV